MERGLCDGARRDRKSEEGKGNGLGGEEGILGVLEKCEEEMTNF